MRDERNGGVKIFISLLFLILVCHVRPEIVEQDELSLDDPHKVETFAESTPEHPEPAVESSSEAESHSKHLEADTLSDNILENVVEKNTEIVEETSLFKESDHSHENERPQDKYSHEGNIDDIVEELQSEPGSGSEPVQTKDNKPTLGINKQLMSDVMKARQVVQELKSRDQSLKDKSSMDEFDSNDVAEVPAPKVEDKEIPGSDELAQAEDILGLKNSNNKDDTIDGALQKPNYRKAYALLQSASSKGNNQAKVLLGFAHLTGDHEPYVSHNTSLAYEMFESGAKSGLPSAQRALGVMFSTGIEANSSQSKALLYYTFAALGGDSLAQMALAFRYWSGISVAQSCESALKYYRLVADNVARKVGSTGTGQVVLRIRLMEEEEESPQNSPILDENLVQYYQFLADKGDLQAQLGLGQLYLQGGRGIERNVKLAQQYFSAAAKSGNTNAYGFMGKISMQLKEYDTALKYYKLATKDPMGQWGMGTLYYNGWGVDQDYTQALTYFTLASQQGHTEAELQLGLMHLSGIGVKKDYGIALKHFNAASKSGHVLAFYNLGMMHAMGIGVMRNCQTAAELLKNVAERGSWGNELMDAHALYHKGFIDSALIKYLILAEQGYEVAQANAAYILDKDDTEFIGSLRSRYKRAFVNWKRAAAQGFGGARLKLGDYYYYGQGTEADPVEAAEQYQIASDVDHNPQAMFNLGYMHELGIGRSQDMHLAKRYYDMAASASVDAHVPTMIANAKLLTKLYVQYLIQFYKEFTFMMLYEGIITWTGSWSEYISAQFDSLAQLFVKMDETATEDWDIYLMSILAVVLGLVMAVRGHNVRIAQMRAAQQNAAQRPAM